MKFYGDYQVYSESGVDLTLLRENMRRTVDTRFHRNAGAVRSIRRMVQKPHVSVDELSMDRILDVESMLRSLTEHKVHFVLVEGLAMRAHGSAHITEDADFCYERTPDSIAALAQAMAAHKPYLRGAPAGLPFHFDAPTIQAGLNFTLITTLGDVDFLGEIKGLGDFAHVDAVASNIIMFGMDIRVLSIDGLIAAKKAAGRAKDLGHLLELEELKKLLQEPRE